MHAKSGANIGRVTALRRAALVAALALAARVAPPPAAPCGDAGVMACCAKGGHCCLDRHAAFAPSGEQDAAPTPSSGFLAMLPASPTLDRPATPRPLRLARSLQRERLLPPPPTLPPRLGRA
jgi:hypothetical protein